MDKPKIPIIEFQEWKCHLKFFRYYNNHIALKLVDATEGDPIAVATVNLPTDMHLLEKDEVYIKDWSENEGMVTALEATGIVKDTGKRVPTGFVVAKVCRLLVTPS